MLTHSFGLINVCTDTVAIVKVILSNVVSKYNAHTPFSVPILTP